MASKTRLTAPSYGAKQLARHWLKLVVIFVYFFLYAPILVLFLTSFLPGEVLRFPIDRFSTRWYFEFFHDSPAITALANSIVLALISSILAAVIGTLCAIGLVRTEFFGKRFVNFLVLVPLIVPPVITGISLVILLYGFGLQRGLAYLVIGHTLLGLPYVVVVVSAQLVNFPRNLEDAALTLGANEIQTFFEVTLPLLSRGITAGSMFAFINSLQEYPATQAWAAPDFYTLPIVMYNKIRDQLSPEINVIGVFMVLIGALLPIVGEYVRRSPGSALPEAI